MVLFGSKFHWYKTPHIRLRMISVILSGWSFPWCIFISLAHVMLLSGNSYIWFLNKLYRWNIFCYIKLCDPSWGTSFKGEILYNYLDNLSLYSWTVCGHLVDNIDCPICLIEPSCSLVRCGFMKISINWKCLYKHLSALRCLKKSSVWIRIREEHGKSIPALL